MATYWHGRQRATTTIDVRYIQIHCSLIVIQSCSVKEKKGSSSVIRELVTPLWDLLSLGKENDLLFYLEYVKTRMRQRSVLYETIVDTCTYKYHSNDKHSRDTKNGPPYVYHLLINIAEWGQWRRWSSFWCSCSASSFHRTCFSTADYWSNKQPLF